MNKQTPILVTGATGFIGAHLLQQLLSAGYTRIRGMRRSSSPMELVAPFRDQVEWAEADLLDPFSLEEAMQGIQVVFHCAAVVSFDPAEAKAMMRANVEGTANVVNTALHLGTEHLIYLSSVAAVGRSKNGATLSEQSKWERSPLNTRYAISKFQGEQEVWRGQAEGLKVAVANPSIVLGSGYWDSGPPRFFQTVWDGISFYPAGTTGLVDVRDVACFMQLLMEQGHSGQRFILNAAHYPYRKLLSEIAEALGKPAPGLKAGWLLRNLAWRASWIQSRLTGQAPFLTRETAKNSSLSFYYKNDRSLQVPGFAYTPISQTIADTAAEFLRSKGDKASLLPIASRPQMTYKA